MLKINEHIYHFIIFTDIANLKHDAVNAQKTG